MILAQVVSNATNKNINISWHATYYIQYIHSTLFSRPRGAGLATVIIIIIIISAH